MPLSCRASEKLYIFLQIVIASDLPEVIANLLVQTLAQGAQPLSRTLNRLFVD
jgi:hypothetical protein